MLDLKVTGGQLLDGTGAPAVRADVGIVGDSITALGDLWRAPLAGGGAGRWCKLAT